MSASLLAAQHLACAAGGRMLFADLNLLVEPGDLVLVRGPNGSGKSTLLRCLAGLLAPERGTVRRGAVIAYVGHKPGVCTRMTAHENLRWFARLCGSAKPAGVDAALAGLDVDDARHTPCAGFSAGQVRRVALARLALANAPVWLLDEPLTALDAAGAARLRGLVTAHRAQGGAVVCATHGTLDADDGHDSGKASPDAVRTVFLGA